MTGFDQALAERVRPPDHLKVQPHDQQQRLAGVTEGLVGDLGVVVTGVLDGHPAPSFSCTRMITLRQQEWVLSERAETD
ncbi:hypothetical protein [Actinoplanes derwentensis]|uniref:hypothetical protein n=1 Tax=Actinoplanes derwentensis TaxID=113562 RepID=UPI0012FDA11C|nr:hypothetical protein [Actinoplanes derwentensis]